MKIEVLYNEFYTYGESENIKYLKMMFKEAEFILKDYNETPYFVDNDVDMIVIEPMPEHYLDMVFKKLLPFKQRLADLVKSGVYFFICNNAMDIFGQRLIVVDEKEYPTLELLNYETIRNYKKRYAYLFVGKYDDIEICGMNNGFSTYEIPSRYNWYTVELNGIKSHDIKLGGYHDNNVYCVEFISQFFIMNPLISKRILKHFGLDETLPFEKEVLDNYYYKLNIFKNDKKIAEHYQK